MFMFDTYYIVLVIPALILSMYAQFRVSSVFNKYSNYSNIRGLTGADVAREILHSKGLYEVIVEPVAGKLTDHYDPRTKVVRLSESVFYSKSLAAIGVAAHETGHAIQHQTAYAPLTLRSTLVPVAGVGSSFGPIMAIVGLMLQSPLIINLGIILFTVAVAFYIITLPVEFNASSRAIEILSSRGILTVNEIEPAKKVLKAAAMTYVASALVAIMSLLRLVLLARSQDSD